MSKVKTNAIRLLDQKKVSYELLTYEVGDQLDGITVAAKINYPVEVVYKTLITRGTSKQVYVFVIPVAAELDLKQAAKVVSEKKLEMIAVSEINGLTGYVRGGCSPVGMKKVYPTVIDVTAENLDYFIVSGGKIGLQMKLNPKDLQNVIHLSFEKVTIEKGESAC